ncbi:bilirubin oxidase [Streptomyces venezuelae]|uniref:Multicopper oxidase CueO n=1 Tax=Streptomyces venezuelae TaxID=54571 RepID=A0A5P2D1H6_STRVZ|nr:multicopper oxidase domain-containing protein [Streptomyces venezuelae]QES48916.1 bilirubin oxidase [Streptomyces venezuelae]
MSTSRRELLKLAVATGGALTASGLLVHRTSVADDRGAAVPAAATVGRAPVATPFQVAMPVPRVLRPQWMSGTTDYYSLPVKEASVEILPGLSTPVLTYGGTFPGPTIKARSRRRTVVSQRNHTPNGTSMHLHGAVTDPENDGGPMDLIATGADRKYTYLNPQVAATLWYHDHAHHKEAEHVYRGMAGVYQLTDANEESLPLPRGAYDVPIVIRDIALNEDGTLFFDHAFFTRQQILVNGKPQPYFKVDARKYRLRVINGSNLRPFDLKLSDGGEFVQIASDRGLLPAPYTTSRLPLSPGERADIIVDFSRYAAGTSVVLENTLLASPTTKEIMRFDVGRKVPDFSSVPARLAQLPATEEPVNTRTFEMKMDAAGTGYMNGKVWDENRVDTTVRWGDTEIWEIKNLDPQVPHNFHIHLVDFRVLDINGVPPVPGEAGLKDTVRVMPGQTVRILVSFRTPYAGRYYYHCHLIDHSAMGMMANLDIVR